MQMLLNRVTPILYRFFSSKIVFTVHYILLLANRLENCGIFGKIRNNSNTNCDGHDLALVSLARRNRD